MPNHVTHIFKIQGSEEELKKFYDEYIGEDDALDFNKLIPMPTILEGTISGNTPEMETEEYKAKAKEAIEATGHCDWYNWRIEHWGTKWNSYSARCENYGDLIELEFDTAWSCPEPIFKVLAEKFPNLAFEGYALDEGFCFGAVITIEEGEFEINYLDVHVGLFEAFSHRFC